jgi:prophage regulatory protein
METDEGIIRYPEVCRLTGLTKSTIARLIEAGKFPPLVPLTQGTVGFEKVEVLIWIRRRIQERTPIILDHEALREKAKARKAAKAQFTTGTLKEAA